MPVKRQAIIFVILAFVSTYVFADAYDLVPGFVTVREREAEAKPYPTLNPLADGGESVKVLQAFSDAPLPEATDVRTALNDFLTSNDFLKGHVSALVTDAVTGKTLGEIDPDTPRTPASNMKMVTALVALETLGPDATFPTVTAMDGDTVYVIGGGDVLLSTDTADSNSAYGHASIAQLAEATAKALKARSVTEIDLLADSTLFDGPLYHASVVSEGSESYVMQARPLGTKETAHTELFEGEPDVQVAEILADKLREQGIEVASVGRSETASPADATELARTHSATVRQLVDYMLTYSDNSTAETLAHLAAIKLGKPATFAGGADATKETLAALGLHTEGLTFTDGSGLSPDNRLNARLLVGIADCVWRAQGGAYGALASGLPVGGYNGTLKARFMDDNMGGLVHAKTGSLSDVVSLSGYLQTKKGRLLEFSIIIDEIPETHTNPDTGAEEPTGDIRPDIDAALSAIADL